MPHTPGPWQFDNRNWRNEIDESGSLYVTGDHHESTTEDDDGNPIDDGTCCVSICRVEGNATSSPVTEANARLIAAAPDLLVACLEAIQAINAHSTEPIPTGVYNRLVRVLNDAIARTE